MPYVRGFLKVGRRHRPGGPVDPDYGVDEGVDPGYGIPEGGHPDHELPEVDPPGIWPRPPIPDPPVGIWPPLTPEHPWRPIPGFPERPSTGPVPPGLPQPPAGGIGGTPPERPQPGPGDGGASPEHPIVLPPGTIWPPLPPGVHGKYLALVLIGGFPGGPRYRYVVIDADARPPRPVDPGYGVEGPPPREPK